MREIQIGGLVSFTTIDYPTKLAAVLFLVGCPLRCAYCSNPHLLNVGDGEYDPNLVMDWIKRRVGKLEAIVFSGGEALMQGDAVIDYMKQVRALGFKIGLHTNGFYPETLKRAIDVIDWVGLDFKAVQEKYPDLTGQNIAYDNMMRSMDILVKNNKDFEVRVTCDPRFVTTDDLCKIAQIVAEHGGKHLAVQKYIPHFEDDTNKTDAAQRNQFFDNPKLRNEINEMFDTVVWRE